MKNLLLRWSPYLLFFICIGSPLNAEAALSISSGTPPNAAVNTAYSFVFTASDFSCDIPNFVFSSNDLPNWLTLTTAGVLSATGNGPASAGAYPFHVTVSDSCQNSTPVQAPYSIQVSSPGESYYLLSETIPITIQALNGGVTVTCANASMTDPCYPEVLDIAVDSSGDYILPVFSGGIFKLPATGGSPTNVVSVAQIPTDTTLGSTAPGSAFFISAAIDSAGNYIALDVGNDAVWFFPAAGGAGSLIGLTNVQEGLSFVRIDGSGNYVVAASQTDVNSNPEIQFYQYTKCTLAGVCPAPQAANPLLAGVGDVPGPIEGALGGFAVGNGQYYVSNEGDTNVQTPYVAKVDPAGPTVGVFFGNNAQQIFEPGPIVYDAQTGNLLVVDLGYGLDAISADGTGLEQIYQNQGMNYYFGAVLKSQAAQNQPPPPAPIPQLILTGGALPQAFADEPYSSAVTASGGVQPYTFTGSGFPPGIGINAYGAISGQTTQTGVFTPTVTVTDLQPVSISAAFTLTVAPPPPVSFGGGTLTSVIVGTPVSTVLSASGGAPPYTYAFAGGTLPTGLSVTSSGTLRGTPLKAGSFAFSVTATDSTGGSAIGSFTMAILPPPLTLNAPSPLAVGTVSIGYPAQTISATGGTAPYTFKVTNGSLPSGLTLSTTGSISGTPTAATPSGGATFTVTATDASTPASTGTATLSLTVDEFSQKLILSAGSIAFPLAAGAATLPPPQNVQVTSTTTSQPLNYTVAVQPASATWISAGSGGATPGVMAIGLTAAAQSLAASNTPYAANVVVTCTSGACAGNSQSLAVTLTVTNPPPQLSVQAIPLSFNTQSSAPQATSASLNVSNTGGGSIGFASIACGAPWCTITGIPGALGPGQSAVLNITADPTGLAAGYYYSSLAIVSSAGSASVPVTFNIAPNGVISLGPAGAAFSLPQGGELGQSNSFLVDITGSTPISFTAAVQPGAPWLRLTSGGGSASGTSPGVVSYGFDRDQVAALAPGAYYGEIQLTAGGASNSPQSFEVVLYVTPASTPTTPDLSPGGLIFLTQAASAPPVQVITVSTTSPNSTNFQASASTSTGGNWLSVTPTTGSTIAGTPAAANVSVNPSGLNPGVYKGLVNFALSPTAVRSVNVTLVVERAASAIEPSVTSLGSSPKAVACAPSQLVPTSTGLVGNFAAPAAWPIELGITLVDDCGNLIGNGQIVATFSNGDPPLILALADPAVASYVGTWTPQHATAHLTINARATAPKLPAATAQIGGQVTPNNAPILADLAIANFYNPIGGAPLAPGALIQITGQYLAGQTVNATTVPLPQSLAGTSVIVGGLPAPVSMVSPGQVNAQVPFELPPGQPYQVIVNANNALTTPQSFQAGAASPGLSVLPSGYVQAGHQNGTAVTEAAPAKPGEIVSIYLVGMGATTIPVASGDPGPGAPFATTQTNPAVTINKESATISFSGLIPGLVGVYQVNVQVPADAPNGDLVLNLAQNAFASNTGLLPVHN